MKRLFILLLSLSSLFLFGCSVSLGDTPAVDESSNQKSVLYINANKNYLRTNEQLTLNIASSDKKPLDQISWQLSNNGIIKIVESSNSELKITALKEGEATIKATEKNSNRTASFAISVVSSIDIKKDNESVSNLIIPQNQAVQLTYDFESDENTKIELLVNNNYSSFFNIKLIPSKKTIEIKSIDTYEQDIPSFTLSLHAIKNNKLIAVSQNVIFTLDKKEIIPPSPEVPQDKYRVKISDMSSVAEVRELKIGTKYDLRVFTKNSWGEELDSLSNLSLVIGDKIYTTEDELKKYLVVEDQYFFTNNQKYYYITPKPTLLVGSKIKLIGTVGNDVVSTSDLTIKKGESGGGDSSEHNSSGFRIKNITYKDKVITDNYVSFDDNNEALLTVVIEKDNADVDYNFDHDIISIPTGEDENGKIQYTGRTNVSGQKVNGKPVYNHEGTNWITYISGPDSSLSDGKINDTWVFKVKENKTSRYRSLTLKFKDKNEVAKFTVKQPRSYNQHETLLWISGVTPPTQDQYAEYIPGIFENGKIVDHKVENFYIHENGKNNGWYNVNKVYHGVEDTNMCWAMAISNAMHWWAEQNKDSLENLINIQVEKRNAQQLYEKGYYNLTSYTPTKLGKEYSNENAEVVARREKSSIGKTVRTLFRNTGYSVRAGLMFFLSSNSVNLPFKNQTSTLGSFSSLGLLDGVEGVDELGIIGTGYLSGRSIENINKILSDALIYDRACLLEIGKSSGNTHEVSIWGIIFDDYGDVIGFYIADNNQPGGNSIDAESVSTSYLQKYGLQYDNLDMPPSLTRLYYEPSHKSYKSDRLVEIITLDSSKKQIEDYVEKNKK